MAFIKKYYVSFVSGFGAGLVAPFTLGSLFPSNKFFPSVTIASPTYILVFLLYCLPFFLIYLLLPGTIKEVRIKESIVSFLFFSFLFFSLGVILFLLIYAGFALYAISQWHPNFL